MHRAPQLLSAVILLCGLLIAGCGGGSPMTPSLTIGRTSTSTAPASKRSPAAGAPSSTTYTGPPALKFAKCMRANGVPRFPDPSPVPGALFNTAGIDTSAPAFLAASAKCHGLTGGGPPIPGSRTHSSAQTMAKLRRIAVCMRAHGVPQFPDPRTTVPSNPPGGAGVIANFDGAVLVFPSSMQLTMQSPAYRQALTACGAPPLGLPH